ncbi:MAG: pyridoxine 5'-phosphate synthase, partial [Nitrospinaceae bacterium]
DRRHIQDEDVLRIKEAIHTPLNLEMAPVEEMLLIALQTKPDQVSLVPEKRQEITTEGGLDVQGQEGTLTLMRERIAQAGIKFSLFVDPEREQIEAAFRVGARSIEINTGAFSECRTREQRAPWVAKIEAAARHAATRGLRVFAGHGLTTDNVGCIAAIPEIEELNIGHHLVSRSVFIGLENAIREMREAMNRGAAAS